MALEDHAGDVLAKARAAAGSSLAEVAAVSGLGPEAYAALEESGKAAGTPDWAHWGEAGSGRVQTGADCRGMAAG
jgi:hypothetical protein